MRKITLIKVDGSLFVKNTGCRTNAYGNPLYFEGNSLRSSDITLAHDIFHHLDFRDIGTLEDELRALGGYAYLDSPEQNITAGINNDLVLLYKYYRNNLDETRIRNKRRLNKYLLNNLKDMVMSTKYFFTTPDMEKFNKFLEISALLVYDGYIASRRKYKNNYLNVLRNYHAVLRVIRKIMGSVNLIDDLHEIEIIYGNSKCYVVGNYRDFF